MTSSGEQGVGQSDPHLQQVNKKSDEIKKLFDFLPPALQLEALDVLQNLVNNVMKKMTNGKVSSVRFVPVSANSDINSPTSAPEITPKVPQIEIKQEPKDDETWSSHPISGHSIGTLQPVESDNVEPRPETLHKILTSSPPLMTSTPKASSKRKTKNAPKKSDTKRKPGKRLLSQLNETDKKKIKTDTPGEQEAVRNGSKSTGDPEDVDVIDDSGIGNSILDVSGETLEELEGYESSESFEENSQAESEDSRDDPDFKVDVKAQSITKVLNWSRQAPKKRKKKDKTKLQFQCEHCSFATSRKYSLDTHMSLHTGESKYKCSDCDKCFTAASSLKRHMMIHEGVRPYSCPVCKKKFVDVAGLRTHSAVHTGDRLFKCEECPKAYTNHANLARHKRVHTGEMPYVCKYAECDAKFRDLSSLKLHTLKHTGEKPYSCPFCQKKFKTSSDFRRHERTHTQERNYKCTECGRTFIQGYHLKQHLKIHADLWLFSCELCNKRFRTKASLQHHMKGHAGVKDYKCDKCGNAFTTKRYLNDHYIAAHTDAKPYKCDVCHKGFNHISNMKRHKRMHSDEYRYKCKFCSRGFKYINSLQYHEGIHTGEKKICEKCGYSCRSIATMKAHVCGQDKKPVKVLLEEVEDSFDEEMLEEEMLEEEMLEEEMLEEEMLEFGDSEETSSLEETPKSEILDVREESEGDDYVKKPRAAARRSGLAHTPRKSKQRAMKMIETITEELNDKSLKVPIKEEVSETDITPSTVTKKNTPVQAKKSATKTSAKQKVNTKKNALPKNDKNADIKENCDLESKKNGTNGDQDELDSTETEKDETNVAHCETEAVSQKKAAAKKTKEAVDDDNNVSDESPKDKSLMEDISVMQEAYGSMPLNPLQQSKKPAVDSGFGDLEKCMPVIAQVYSVQN